ncbi:MAG TPA: O-antigen ligase family protein [Candidatus Udaeobacter sp.]|jgi:O-antigen ligase
MRFLAILLCVPFIWWLWQRDVKARPGFSRTFWIPVFWMLILGSRPLSWWLGITGSGSSDLEGNWFDRLLYLGLIFAAIYILSKRQISWGALIEQNKALVLFYAFLLATLIWAPFPFVAFKRWFKDIGAIFIILLVLTETDPLEASKALFARCAYVWFPLSEIFAKYFPGIGREYSHGGSAMYSGVTPHKNTLGAIIFIAAFFLITELFDANRPLFGRPLKTGRFTRFLSGHHFTILITLIMGMWLLRLSSSRTSQICFVIGVVIILAHKIPVLRENPRRVVLLCLVGLPIFYVSNKVFGISDELLALIGRNPTLTGRTEIWEAIKQKPVNPVIGIGYMMYWDYSGGVDLERETVQYKTSHNGYLDTYLDGGALGLCFLGIMLLAVGRRATREYLMGSQWGRLAFAVFVTMLLYNVTETTYGRRSALWFAFLLFALQCRGALPFWRVTEDEVVGPLAEDGELVVVGASRSSVSYR